MERIMTLHPEGKKGVNISKAKYDVVAAAIKTALENGHTGFGALMDNVGAQISETFDGSVGWYVTSVKLDLEARGVIERVEGVSPQQLRLKA